MNYLTAVHTDVGNRKNTNQDSVLIETAATDYGKVLMGVVCDGMGGLEKGEVASAMLVKAFSRWFHQKFPQLLYSGFEVNALKESWIQLILEENQKIKQYGLACNVNLGTTLTALLLVDCNYYVVNVGDSRIYHIQDKFQQITQDQSYVQREISLGHLTLEEAKNHPRRNVLLQCVGACNVIEPDFYIGNYQQDSLFMMCSDGFYHMITPEEFYEKLKPEFMVTEEKMKKAAAYFTELNKVRKEDDNISVVLIRAY